MELNINLGFQKIARIDGDTVISLPDTLSVTFVSEIYELSELIVYVKNGKQSRTYKVTDCNLDLFDFMHDGEIQITVCLVVKGNKCKEWAVVPIIIKEIGGTLYAFDELDEVRAELANEAKKRETRENELLTMIATLTKTVENLRSELYQVTDSQEV